MGMMTGHMIISVVMVSMLVVIMIAVVLIYFRATQILNSECYLGPANVKLDSQNCMHDGARGVLNTYGCYLGTRMKMVWSLFNSFLRLRCSC